MKTIVINNPAAKEGGALTVLESFLKTIHKQKCKNIFYIFVSVIDLKKYEKNNIKIIVLERQNFRQRLLWDNIGLKKYLKLNKIKPDLFLSLQNTGVNLPKKIPQILYFHQALSISDIKWDILKKEERTYYFYQNIYPFFIRQYLNRITKIIVQTNWIKEKFSKKFNYSLSDIIVEKPVLEIFNIEAIEIIPKTKFRIFYPATPFIYKNHKLIIESLKKLKEENLELESKLECIFTFSRGENAEIDKLIKKYSLENIIQLVGKISYEKVLEYYKNSDLLIFPSYIETLGLPLIEAKKFNLNILAVDLPYSREAIGSYKNVKYFKSFDLIRIYDYLTENIHKLKQV
ncbi:glycosyltransferase [uncultured Fusobacterium sp.]|uniref:glycosyltransferase n=1 Tax=uncultured Fusobacterium sp. TaxID=159267 RepID=UPI0025E0F6C4|nr:glycosyltransferase [uncultured Fusobacterium sp.]